MWDKKFSTENLDTPPFLSINFFATGIILKQSTQGFPYEILRHCETKYFLTENRDTPPSSPSPPPSLIHKFFRYQKFCETQKGSPTNFFGTVRQNNFDKKSWNPPPLLSLKFFGTRNFLKHRRVPQRNFLGTVRQKFFIGKSWCPFA